MNISDFDSPQFFFDSLLNEGIHTQKEACQPEELIQKAQEIIKNKPFIRMEKLNEAIDEKHLLKQIVNVGLKGRKDSVLDSLHKDYDGLYVLPHAYWRANLALKLLEQVFLENKSINGITSNEEKIGLLQICKQRNIFLYYANLLNYVHKPDSLSVLTFILNRQIGQLDHPHSKDIIRVNENITCFAIPGGSKTHLVSYEFRKEKDDYYFILHNRGAGIVDHPTFHGKAQFLDDTGKIYSKTSVKIKVPLDVLKDRQFLSELLEAKDAETIDTAYQIIDQYLIQNGKGTIVKSELETVLEDLSFALINPFISKATKEEIRKLSFDLLPAERAFHSQQLYGTCVESNATAIEKAISPASTIRAVKLFGLMQLTNDLATDYLAPDFVYEEQDGWSLSLSNLSEQKEKQEAELMDQFLNEKIEDLKQNIAHPQNLLKQDEIDQMILKAKELLK